MSEEKPFTSENPFRQLDKKRFQTVEEKKKVKSLAKTVKKEDAPSFYSAFMSPEEEGDSRAFMAAVSGVAKLGTPEKNKKKKATTTTLDNPVLKGGVLETKPPVAKTPPVAEVAQQPATQDIFPEDDAAFFTAVQDVTPLSGKGRAVVVEAPLQAPPLTVSNPLQDFMDGKLEFALAFTDEYVEGHVLGLDLMVVGKLQAGQFSPESHLDLHGMNTQQAFDALIGFFRGAYFKGQRTVLVVPGRGLNSPHGISILREKVQEWFTQEPLKRVILAFCTAKASDGGAGALYVLLRKCRKGQGKICWERKPADPDLV